ncbi:hypothetical protein NKI74_21425 [Mesorhizobium sp. M0494]|uniref:hypothetical protein n=1 Tax=Mesorhizobium sp. M0494 TaxID=2956951 RepID=UPI00333DC91C
MNGLDIVARSMSVATSGSPGGKPFQNGNAWQYHPRSDRHSKIACWALMYDLLLESELLRHHVSTGKVAIGINHEMRDFARNRAKNLDLVICRAAGNAIGIRKSQNFADLIVPYTIVLSEEEKRRLVELPVAPLAQPATVLVALEAKACMTEFGKARPRLYDELNSSQLTIHGDTDGAIAAGFALVNAAESFVSPIRNPWPLGSQPTVVSHHHQPKDMRSVAAKLTELPRRARPGDSGFDAFAIGLIECANDGRPVKVKRGAAGEYYPEIYDYAQTIGRLAHLYATRFSSI